MYHALKLHPDSHCMAVTQIDVGVTRPSAGLLVLHYVVTGKIAELRLPRVGHIKRGVKLWQHTCFEAFLRASKGDAYCEFNCSPSLQWAVYRFAGYRDGMEAAKAIRAPGIAVSGDGVCYELQVSWDLDGLPGLPINPPWLLGLSAVIEETNGRKSYWALAHPPGGADFHHAAGFVLELPEPA
jgi:hypothetical protein